MVPALEQERKAFPTLGDQVADWIEENLTFGPGDLRGEPAVLDAEKRALLCRMYELYPKGHAQEGRRRFRRCAISLRKGSAKSEFAAQTTAAELHPRAPVRFNGWDKKGAPLYGRGVRDPYIPLIAYTEEQSEDLVYGALLVILEESKSIRADFDIGLERIMRIKGDGKAVAVAGAPNARDGARTTFQVFDETHRFVTPRLRKAHKTMLANLPKRKIAEPWSLEITTAPAPGENSVAEDVLEFAKAVSEKRAADPRFFFFHRQATEGKHDLSTEKGRRAAVLEASGPVAEWSDVDFIVGQWADPTADYAYLNRVWLNQPVRAADRAFDVEQLRKLHRKKYTVAKGARITIGFDGGRTDDSTALVACEVDTGYQFRLGLWEKPYQAEEPPPGVKAWEVPVDEVNQAVEQAFADYTVCRLYADPPYWSSEIAEWTGKHGDKVVIQWPTYRPRHIAMAVLAYHGEIKTGTLQHDGDPDFIRHAGNCFRRELFVRDDQGKTLWTVQKERPKSPNKIDYTLASILSREARRDVIAEGQVGGPSVYEERGLVTV